MLYPPPSESIPMEHRADVNAHLMDVLRSGNVKLKQGEVYHAFTGKGGLHGLNFNAFESYADYSAEKKLYEEGQFFTPDALASEVVKIMQLKNDELICDPTCGKGSFFNYIPNLARVYGNELDKDAFLVAKHCFPNANIEEGDILAYRPNYAFDVIIGNPPFGLNWYDNRAERTRYSQHIFVERCAEWLKPGGLLAVITPMSYLNDAMHQKANIEVVDGLYNFIGQATLEVSAFASLGVKAFATKLLVLQRKSENLRVRNYEPCVFETLQELQLSIGLAREEKEKVSRKLTLEAIKERATEETTQLDKLTKLFFDIGRSNAQGRLAECKAMLEKWQTESKPKKMGWEEWEKTRLTLPRIIEQCKNILSRQHEKERNEIKLVPCKEGFKLKGYDKKSRAQASNKLFYTNHLLSGEQTLPIGYGERYARALRKKAKTLAHYQQDLSTMKPDANLLEEIKKIRIYKDNGESFAFNDMQRYDLARLISRNYAYCAYAPGAGKTGLAFAWRKYKPAKRTFILAPAIAIRGTWQGFLGAQNTPFITLDAVKDIDKLKSESSEVIALITLEQLKKHKRLLKKYIKRLGYNITLIFDEADEICNYGTKQTQAALAVFRKAKAKLLMTGTATRNNLNEFYPQLELLYNNSYLMPCEAPELWRVNKKGEMESRNNPFYGLPFPARKGQRIYSQSFSPRKPSVFGIAKNNQDVYNLEALDKLVSNARISRTFQEVAGDDKYRLHQHIIPLNEAEKELQTKLLNDFYTLMENYYTPTGNSRKEAGLRAVRQLRLLIEMCAHAHLFDEYEGEAKYSQKMRHAKEMVKKFTGELVAIGLTRKKVWGRDYLGHWENLLSDLNRPTFLVDGGMNVAKRMTIIAEYQKSKNGILISTQDALKSSVNIPECKQVIIPMLQWNMSRMVQFYHRFVRLDMQESTDIHFISHAGSIEANLWGLLVNKERLNGVIKHGQHVSKQQMTKMLSLNMDVISNLMAKEYDTEGKVQINWTQTMAA